jgi:hypothetical protein
MATGRSVGRFVKFQIHDSGGTLRDIAVSNIGGVGVSYDQVDLTALNDALKGFMSGHGDVTLAISGPFSNTAAAAASGSGAAASYSGSHTVLAPLNGGRTPLTFAVLIGIQSLWSTGDPVFGITSSATSGATLFDYIVDPSGVTYSATLKMSPGSLLPAFGTAAHT